MRLVRDGCKEGHWTVVANFQLTFIHRQTPADACRRPRKEEVGRRRSVLTWDNVNSRNPWFNKMGSISFEIKDVQDKSRRR